MKKKWIKIISVLVSAVLLAVIIRYGFVLLRYSDKAADGSWLITQHPFFSAGMHMDVLVEHDGEIPLMLWWDGLTGDVAVRITDENGNARFQESRRRIDTEASVFLEEGRYGLDLDVSGFTGAIAIGYDDIIEIRDFPSDRYTVVPADPSRGFQWKYILYVPEEIAHEYLLVIPNNTGYPTGNMAVHEIKAKNMSISQSGLADALGVALLVPVFPRPETHPDIYTHALDRAATLTDIPGLERLDEQLIAMIEDGKVKLRDRGVEPEDQILMSGFSASADFIDGFTLLHPRTVKAVSLGGALDLTLPCAELQGENLPYPLGVYDYEAITGKPFDRDAFASVYRRLYKGSADEGGWITEEKNGEVVTYTAKEYYEQYQLPEIEEALRGRPSPIYTAGDVSETNEREIAFRVFGGQILLERFLAVQSIFSKMGLDRNEFVIYDGVGHSVTDEMRSDELSFFRRVLTQ